MVIGSGTRRKGLGSILVEPYLQVKLGLMFLLLNAVFGLLILGVFGFFVFDMYRALVESFQLSGIDSIVIWSKFRVPLVVGTILIVAFGLSTLFVAVRYTHRIYGPLVSIHRYLDSVIARQPVSPLQLRESDQLRDLAHKLNRVAEMLQPPARG